MTPTHVSRVGIGNTGRTLASGSITFTGMGNPRRTRLVALFLVAFAVAAQGGCATKPKEKWSPQPRVFWDHLSTQPFEVPTEGFHILAALPSTGLFPANLAVGRVAVAVDAERGGDNQTGLFLRRDPRNEFLQWNRAFDDQMAVSSVFPVSQRNLAGGEATPDRVIAVMQALGARLGLLYAVNEVSKNDTEMIGVLYETAGFRPIATFRAVAATSEKHRSVFTSSSSDPFETESKALVRERFEKSIYACMRHLIANDDPAEIESAEGWLPPEELRRVLWPPIPNLPGF